MNDALALKRVDEGIAMHGVTETAKDAADMALSKPGLSTIHDGTCTAL